MKLHVTLDESLCAHLMECLLAQGDALLAALQAAGCERKTEGWVQQGLSTWLAIRAPDLVCLTEYLDIDFAVLRRDSIGQDRLVVDTMIEAKFNYTSQTAELVNRPGRAAEQLDGYLKTHPGADGYLLYLLADHAPRPRSTVLADRGWRYLRQLEEGRFETGVALMQASARRAGLVSKGLAAGLLAGWRLHLEVFAPQSQASGP